MNIMDRLFVQQSTMRRNKSLSAVIILLLLTPWLIPSADAQKQEPSKPRIAVLEFKNKTDNQWWNHGGAATAQDVFVTELSKSLKSRVVKSEKLQAQLQEKLDGDINPHSASKIGLIEPVNPKTASEIGKLLGVNYLLMGMVTEDWSEGAGGKGSLPGNICCVAMNARLIDTSTGKIVWADEARLEVENTKLSSAGLGGRVDDNRLFDQLMKPCIKKLVASLLKAGY